MKSVLTVIALLAVTPSLAHADERILQFRSVEDPASPADPAVCALAPFRVNVRLGASLYTTRARAKDGMVVEDDVRKIGTATACVQLTNFSFPAGLAQKFYVRFNLADGAYTAVGTCTLISNDVPRAGLVLAGCNLRMTGFPAGVVGGVATSSSVFNPFRLAGFNTGSYWSLQLYDTATVSPLVEHKDHGHDMEDHDDRRSDDEIAAK